MQEQLKELTQNATNEAKTIANESDYLNIKAKYLGKKSQLSEYMASIKEMSTEEKKTFGPLFNKMKNDLEALFTKYYEAATQTKETVTFDPTLPVQEIKGSLHPVTMEMKEITDIFKRMGFSVVSGPEMDTDYYTFKALNFPDNHPARDSMDTFWLSNGDLLRCHLSGIQVRSMEKWGAPIRVIYPGRCYRNENVDASHGDVFFQIEGMVVDKDLSIGHLVYIMKGLLKEIFKKDIKVRLRQGFFPFVEPGFELDASCLLCDGVGCPACKNSGWMELLPCGMIHPNVLKYGGIDPNEYNGFAFCLGLTRSVMLKYKINDQRYLNSGDLRFLKQFNIE